MLVTFRTDASLHIGTGHVMRCLTLADELANKGASCRFICREHDGHLLAFIHERGHTATGLPSDTGMIKAASEAGTNLHQSWLGADEPSADAQKSALFLNANNSLLETLMDEATAPLENSACQTKKQIMSIYIYIGLTFTITKLKVQIINFFLVCVISPSL